MRMFHDQINMGSGINSGNDCYELICQLQTALSILSGLQQPMMSTDKEKVSNSDEDMDKIELEWHTTSIVKALLGRNARVVREEEKS